MKTTVPLKRATRLLNHGGLAFVTAKHGGRANVMPAAWVVPLSHEPPLVGVAIAPERFTHDLVKHSGRFALSIPGMVLAEKVKRCGEMSGRDVADKFAAVGLTPVQAQVIDAPLVGECLGHVECKVVQSVSVGDHTLFVGRIVAAQAEREAFEEMWLLPPNEALRPMHHLGGNYFAALEKRVEVL